MTTISTTNAMPGLSLPIDGSRVFSEAGATLQNFGAHARQRWNERSEQREHRQLRINRLLGYITNAVETQAITSRMGLLTRFIWEELERRFGERMVVPDTGYTSDGGIIMSWDKGDLHFEVEITPDEQASFFFLNHATDAMWEEDYAIGNKLPDRVVQALQPFLIYD